MRAGTVSVRLLVRAHLEARNVARDAGVSELKPHLTPAAAALLPLEQPHGARVGNEPGLPDTLLEQLALSVEVALLAAEAVGELERAVEDEIEVVVLAQRRRQVGDGDVADRLRAAVEVLVPRVQRNREQAALRPLERLLVLLVIPDARRAAPEEHVDDLLVHVMLRLRRAARSDLHNVRVLGARRVEVEDRAATALPRPGAQLYAGHVLDVVPLHDGHALRFRPIPVRVDAR